jgi:hypothetical protein
MDSWQQGKHPAQTLARAALPVPRMGYEGYHQSIIDVLRVDDPAYKEPLLVGTTARELSTWS